MSTNTTASPFIPASLLLEDIGVWPADLVELDGGTALLEQIGVRDVGIQDFQTQTTARFTIVFADELSLTLPGLTGISLVFGGTGTQSEFKLEVDLREPTAVRLVDVSLALRFASDILKPVHLVAGSFELDPTRNSVEIGVTGSIIVSGEDVRIEGMNELSLAPCMIADSGIVIEASSIALDLSRTSSIPQAQAAGLPSSWMGVFIEEAAIHLPPELTSAVPSGLTFQNCFIGSGGFTGQIELSWDPAFGGQLGGVEFSLHSFALDFRQNSFARSEIDGVLQLPFFDEPVDVEIGFSPNGLLSLRLSDPTGLLTLEKSGILSVELDSIGFEIGGGMFIASISGRLTPLFGGLDWPTFDVKELSIDSQGNVHLDGGWLDLPGQYTLSFYGFLIEITKIGFGKSDDGGKWVGFSGGLTLCQGLTAGASVDGLRITWYSDGREPEITLDGVGVEFAVPDVLSFKGDVAYRELEVTTTGGATEVVHRFDGDIKLELEALDIAIDGKLVIGSVDDPITGTFPFLAIYLSLDLPAGLPLWATGLALYGLAGLFALEMAPNKGLPPNSADETWYENADGSPGWYKRPAIGVTDLASKWDPLSGSQALGGGITLGTVADNGYTFSGQVLLVITLPGPILLIEGRANMLKKRAELDAREPTFRALAVLDGQAGTFLMDLDAQYTFGNSGELIDIHGGAEAFFSFHDAQAWHLHLGEKDPRERRLRAAVFKLFEADAYFLLDANRLALGAHVGYDEEWKFGPLGVTLQAWIEGNSVISWKPDHFYGDLALHGQAGLAVFGFKPNLTVDAQMAADVFDPFHILGSLQIGVDLPFPLPDVQVGITLEWGPVPTSPPLPHPLKEVAIEHFKVTTSWPLPRQGTSPLLLPNYDSNDDDFLEDPVPSVATQEAAAPPANVPLVPLDCRPHITFARPMNDDAFVGVNVQPQVPEWERIGDPEKNEGPLRVRYSLEEVALYKFENDTWVLAARKGTNPNAGNEPSLYGSWAPTPQMPAGDGENTGQVKLWLWSKTPFDYSCHTGGAWDDWFTDRYPTYPCISLPEDQQECFDFEKINPETLLISPWTYPGQPGLIFSWPISTALTVSALTGAAGEKLAQMLCLPGRTGVARSGEATIDLPQPVKQVDLFFVEAADIQAMGIDVQGAIVPAHQIDEQHIEISGADITRVVLRIVAPQACLLQICLTSGLTKAERARRQKMIQHQQDALAHWSEVGTVLEPHTTYRLKIVSRLQAQGTGELAHYSQDLTQTEFAYFRTEGPPGLTTYSVPVNHPTPDEFDSGLNDLTRYVAQTVPATVPPAGEKPLLPRPVYCAYDVSVVFNEDYVDLMYHLEDRELGLCLYNNNNQPARDIHGRLLVFANHWGTVGQLTLPDSAQRWVNVVNASDCLSLDPTTIPHPVILSSAAEGQVLTPDTVYEARLVPLLLHEDFRSLPAGIDDPGSTAPVVYRFSFTTSHFANFFHQIHSFQDETWQVNLDATVDLLPRLSQAVAIDTLPSPEEALTYEALEGSLRDQISSSPGEVQVTRITQKGETVALLLQSPEPVDWSRTELAVKATASLVEPSTLPKEVKLTDVTFGSAEPDEESVTLLLRQAANLSGYRLEYRIGSQGTIDEAPSWTPYYTFGPEELLPAGTQVRIFSGSPDNAPPAVPGVRQRFCAPAGQQGQCQFSSQANAVTLRLLGPEKRVRHRRQFLPESAYTPVTPKVLRKADGTAFFLVIPADSAAAASHYRLDMTYRRDNQLADPGSIVLSEGGNTAAEEVKIDVSWMN